MKIEFFHASEYGNGAMVAEEFRRIMEGKGIAVNVHHIDDVNPKEIPSADLYIFSSPGRFGKPIKGMQKFLKKLQMPAGSRYALLVTEMNPGANETPIPAPTTQELGKCQQVIPIMTELLQEKGFNKIADGKIFVVGLKGPLENNWQKNVENFASVISNSP